MYELKKMERYLRVNLLEQGPRLMKKEFTGPREILLELITNLNVILYLSTRYTVHIIVVILFMIMP